MSSIRHKPILMFTISISVFGMLIVLMLAFNPPRAHESFSLRKPLIGSIFGFVCILGIFAVFFPKQCSETFYFKKKKMNSASHTAFKGHHINCTEFSARVIQIGSRTLCAACSGLFIGALIALAGTVLYFFDGWHIEEMSLPLALMGVLAVVLGFLQLKFRGFIRLALNALFVVGALLILVGIDELAQNLFADFFLIIVIVFWLFTRIILSQWDHWRTCHVCKSSCELKRKKNGVSVCDVIHREHP